MGGAGEQGEAGVLGRCRDACEDLESISGHVRHCSGFGTGLEYLLTLAEWIPVPALRWH